MTRRNLLSLASLSTIAWAIAPLHANTWQSYENLPENQDPWKAETSKEAIKLLYPDKEILLSEKIYLKAPKLAENGGSIPIYIKTDLKAKRVMLFQDANPTSLVGIFEVHKDEIVDYSFYIKMRQEAFIKVLIEDINGLVYVKSQEIYVSSGGGCGG